MRCVAENVNEGTNINELLLIVAILGTFQSSVVRHLDFCHTQDHFAPDLGPKENIFLITYRTLLYFHSTIM